MASLQREDTVDLGGHDKRLFEKHHIHERRSGLIIKALETVLQRHLQLAHIVYFFIHAHVLIPEEVDEDRVEVGLLSFFALHGGDVLVEVHLEMLLQRIIENLPQLRAVVIDQVLSQTILEHTLDLVTPELDNLLLAVVEILVCLEQSLEHLADVTHVELVVTELGRGQESTLCFIEDLDGGEGQHVIELLDLVVEALELELTDNFVDAFGDGFIGDGEVEHVEV